MLTVVISQCLPRAESELGPAPSAHRGKARREPDAIGFYAQFHVEVKPQEGKELAQSHPAECQRMQATSAPNAPGFIVSPSFPVPDTSHSPPLGTTTVKTSFSLFLQHPRVPRANLNLFLSCVTMVKCTANTWRGAVGRV